jgi:hypothetical protein
LHNEKDAGFKAKCELKYFRRYLIINYEKGGPRKSMSLKKRRKVDESTMIQNCFVSA